MCDWEHRDKNSGLSTAIRKPSKEIRSWQRQKKQSWAVIRVKGVGQNEACVGGRETEKPDSTFCLTYSTNAYSLMQMGS